MSEALISNLQRKIEELTAENANLSAENANRRTKGQKAGKEMEQLREQLKALTGERESLAAERDTFRAKAEAKPGEEAARIADLEGQIRTRDHRDAFAGVKEFEAAGKDGKAKKYRLADGVSVEDVWQLTGYKPEGEMPEGKTVSEQLGLALQAKPYLFTEAAAAPNGATRPIAVHAREGGPGAGKGNDSATVTAATGGRPITTGRDIPGRF